MVLVLLFCYPIFIHNLFIIYIYLGTIDDFLFANDGLGDIVNGIILLVMSLVMLCSCLIIMVKCLNSLLKGTVARWIQYIINIRFDKPFGWVTGTR